MRDSGRDGVDMHERDGTGWLAGAIIYIVYMGGGRRGNTQLLSI